MTNTPPDIQALFCEAIEQKSPEELQAYLDSVCAGDADLRANLEELLDSHRGAGNFLGGSASVAPAPNIPLLSEGPGTQIGPYKLLEQIGEGGMGTVFLAEQTQPVKRKVALKVIKPGMDSRQVIARFEAERQALAVMDHVNIARVFDAGATDAGRPYFAMELVDGVPITEYCDDNRLALRQRLELFLPVCQAIQHAHQKGIIHRDIKPSNVMIALSEGRPVPKVIDFGVAKATEQKFIEQSLFTQHGTLVGTLEYMSPEQAEMSELGVDTRSDVYSLGVLLYELLTGSTPLDHKRMRNSAYVELLRMIREQEPPRPSTRLSESGDALASISANRHIEPAKLSKLLRGELDWIVMKTLEKDRNRRYETASEFAADVQRYLADEPVGACPPSARYRVGKFLRRNKGPVAAVTLVVLVLVAGIIGTTWGLVQAKQAWQAEADRAASEAQARQDAEEQSAIAQAVNDFINTDLLTQASPEYARISFREPERELKLRTVLDRAAERIEDRFKDQPLVEAALRQTIGLAYDQLDEPRLAEPHLKRAVELRRLVLGDEHPDTLKSMRQMALTSEDEQLLNHLLAIQRRVLGPEHQDVLWFQMNFAVNLRRIGENSKAIVLLRGTLATQQKVLGDERVSTAWTKHVLAHTLFERSIDVHSTEGANEEEIETLYRQALAVYQHLKGDRSWYTYDIALRLGQFLSSRARYEEAEAFWQDRYERLRLESAVPRDWQATIARELVKLYQDWGKPERAAEWERKLAADTMEGLKRESQLLRERPDDPALLLSYASLLAVENRLADAEVVCFTALELDSRNPRVADQLLVLATAYHTQKKWEDAERLIRRALTIRRELGDDKQTANSLQMLVLTLRGKGDSDAAEMALRDAIHLQPESPGPHQQFGDLLAQRGRPAEAEAAYREAIRLNPNGAGQHHNLGDALRAQGKLSEAIAEYGEAIRLDSRFASSNHLRDCARKLVAEQKPIEAAAGYREAIRLKPEDTALQDELAQLLESQGWPAESAGKPEDLAADFLKSLELLASSGAQHREQVAIYRQLAAWDEVFKRVAASRPDDSDLWIERGRYFVLRSQWEPALSHYVRGFELRDALEGAPVIEYAIVLRLNGDDDGYRRICAKMVERHGLTTGPGIAFHLAAVCGLSAQSGVDPQQVVDWAERADTHNRDKQTLVFLGMAQYRAGHFTEAAKLMQERLEFGTRTENERNPLVTFPLALTCQAMSQPEKAQEWYRLGCDGLKSATPTQAGRPAGWSVGHWLHSHLLLREAQAVLASEVQIDGPSVPREPQKVTETRPNEQKSFDQKSQNSEQPNR